MQVLCLLKQDIVSRERGLRLMSTYASAQEPEQELFSILGQLEDQKILLLVAKLRSLGLLSWEKSERVIFGPDVVKAVGDLVAELGQDGESVTEVRFAQSGL